MLKRFLAFSQKAIYKNGSKNSLQIPNIFFSTISDTSKPSKIIKSSSKNTDPQESLRFIKRNIKSRFDLPTESKIKLIESVKYINFKSDKFSLAELKAIFQILNRDWLGNKKIQEALENIDVHFDTLLANTKDILDIENLLSPLHFGLLYLDESRKLKIFHKLMTILNTQRKSLGIISRIFSYLANITNLSAGEIEQFTELIVELGKRSPGEDNFEKAIIFAINSILIQKRYENQHLLELLEFLEERPLKDPSIKNILIFNLEHIKTFLPKDQLIEKSINSIYSKLPSSNYERITSAVDSNTQAKIGNLMIQEGYFVRENQEIGIYSIDFLLKPKLIIEYHGFSHYYVNKREIIKLHQMKIDYLKALGYYVQIIPYYEWHGLEKHDKQVEYINEIIYKPFP